LSAAEPPLRIGVFGGAFDPPHNAHVALAQAAISVLGLNQLRVMPTGRAWHKSRDLTDAKHRLAMCQLAFEPLAHAVVDDREVLRPGPSYTVDTLGELKAQYPCSQLYLLLGDDQRRSLPSWHKIDEIARLAIICAAGRDAAVQAWGDSNSGTLSASAHSFDARIQTLKMPLMPHSATDIRALVATDRNIQGLVPSAVERYIHEHHLYRPH
jgi:nicotinate-nucleotide adenylyltransferase